MSETPHENDPRHPNDPSRVSEPELDPNRPEGGRWESVGNRTGNSERRFNHEKQRWEDVDPDGNFEDRSYDTPQTEEIAFLSGNRNTPVLLLGDDPSNQANETDNVLIVPLGTAVSVPRNTVGSVEGTAEDGTARNEN